MRIDVCLELSAATALPTLLPKLKNQVLQQISTDD